jgi:hypothetical protein
MPSIVSISYSSRGFLLSMILFLTVIAGGILFTRESTGFGSGSGDLMSGAAGIGGSGSVLEAKQTKPYAAVPTITQINPFVTPFRMFATGTPKIDIEF